jgi:DnaJ-class molecular chaperone
MQIAECYKVLNVSPGEDWRKVRKSYHSLAKQFHPDVNPEKNNTGSRLVEINQAFEKLETHYKASCHVLPEQQSFSEQKGVSLKGGKLFLKLRNNPAVQRALRSGLNFLVQLDTQVFQLHIQKDITLSESTFQKGANLHMKSGKDRFHIKVPSGDWNQMSLRISGKGESSLFSKRRGDLVLNFRVPVKETAKSANTRFYYEMSISPDLIAGRKTLTLNSSDGPIKFILPRNTRDGQSFTLRSGSASESETLHILTVRIA